MATKTEQFIEIINTEVLEEKNPTNRCCEEVLGSTYSSTIIFRKKNHARTSNIDVTKEGDIGYSSSLNIVKHDDTEEIIKLELRGYKWSPERVCCTRSADFLFLLSVMHEPLKVAQYSRSGSEIQTIQYDPEGNPLSTKEHSIYMQITENKNMDVCVSTADLPKKHGTLVVVDKSGLLRLRYDQISRKYPFTPNGQGINNRSCIFVTDSRNNFIDVISKDGNFLYLIDCNNFYGQLYQGRVLIIMMDYS